MHADCNARHGSRARLVATLALVASAAFAVVPQTALADVPYFYIVNASTRMMAEVLGRRVDDGAPVVLWPNYGGPSQQFSLHRLPRPGNPEPLQDQWFMLSARHSGKCLKTHGFQSGAVIVQETCSGDASQLWRLRTLATTAADCPARGWCLMQRRMVLENFYEGGRRCLDAAHGLLPSGPEQGAGLHARDCVVRFSATTPAHQEWELVDVQEWDAPFIAR
ncbi:RICIN domain-containing protein [Variovorax sp. J22R24]|uniref:RICIN domain-containing protein n=1 Tax=Variovorax gracilis TaxID=3053502 RepID=UPI0025750E42|nr:RICIN domain-containing protein [Variovorax sp. J22R24]MDM0109424.1 RICIN domain-containing protein [Variovorax sp. J22R24]